MAVLVHKGVFRTLLSMAVPMLAGTFAMNAYNLTDTWFVSRLGTLPLAAMGFTFPVVMLLTAVAMGIASGITPLVSHAIGRHDHQDAAKLVTHGMLFIGSVTVLISIAGYLLITPIFTKLGADHETLPLVGQYMRIWYIGAVFMAMPMFGNGMLLSMGDSKTAARFMMLGTILNLILDPIMIFGYLGFPAMGIRGAAIATVIAQAVATAWLVYLLCKKHHLILLRGWGLKDCAASLRRIVSFAIPGVLSMILMPISATVITKLLSHFGNTTIAAIGVITRLEMFAFMIPMAMGISLVPFVSQNFGAEQFGRVRRAWKLSTSFAIGYGALMTLFFFIGAHWLASLFTDDPKVAATIEMYTRIVPIGYGMMEVHRYSSLFLTGLHKPTFSAILNCIRVLVLLIPLSYLGAHFGAVSGVFNGRLATDFIAGAIGLICVSGVMRGYKSNLEPSGS